MTAARTGITLDPYTPRAMTSTDAQLIQRVRADETGEAMRALYRTYSGELYGFTLNALGERGIAEEVVQEVFTRAWRHAESYDPGRGSVRTWVLGIVHNRAIDALRRTVVHERRRASDEGIEERFEARERTEVEAARREEASTIRGMLETLPDEQSRVIELAYFGGFTHSEIAEMLGAPIGTVKGRMRLGLEKLRGQLAPQGAMP